MNKTNIAYTCIIIGAIAGTIGLTFALIHGTEAIVNWVLNV